MKTKKLKLKKLRHEKTDPFVDKFKREIRRSLALTPEQKKFWEENAETTPEEILKQVYGIVKPHNDEMQKYIEIAIQKDPSLLKNLKDKIREIKKETLKLAEGEQTPDAEQTLEEQLKNV